MEATSLSLARSVLDSVVKSTGSVLADHAALLLGVRREVVFIRDELEMMQAFLRVAAALPVEQGHTPDTVKTWVKQVRDLAYEVEDCLQEFALYARRWSSWVNANLPLSVGTRHRIATQIRELKWSIQELNQRNRRYNIINDQRISSSTAPTDEPQLADVTTYNLLVEESHLVGREDQETQLINLISSGNGSFMVVSVYGMGGMGKTTLVGKVFNSPALIEAFPCRAWVNVPHPFNEHRVKGGLEVKLDTSDVKQYLQDKKYVIVVDDVSLVEEWESIKQILPTDTNCGSRVLVTTRREDVAKHCATQPATHAYHLKALTAEQSLKLLCQKAYRMLSGYPEPTGDMLEQASIILQRCKGLPLAIATIGGLLANRPKTSSEWTKIHRHLSSELESDDLANVRKVIISSYDGLPYHLKSCFLYLSIFPENHEIRQTRLLGRWKAEGYIIKRRDMTAEDVGERYYNELISRSMIQPCKRRVSPSVKIDRCQVHSVMLEIILLKSIEENQLFLIDEHCSELPQDRIRHLVVTNRWKGREKILASINFSRLRSLTVFGECPPSIVSPKMRLLRVLDLEDTIGLKNEDLKHIGELRHLMYLGLRGTKVSELPESMKKLKDLETLDIQDTNVTKLPNGIVKLERLRYLLAGDNFSKGLLQKNNSNNNGMHPSRERNIHTLCCGCNISCNISCAPQSSMAQFGIKVPQGFGKLSNLHMLGSVDIGQGTSVVKEIGKLVDLRRLAVTGVTEKHGEDLCDSIGQLSQLLGLEVCSKGPRGSLSVLKDLQPLQVPKHLISLRLYGKLYSLPAWIGSLNNLAKVKLLATKLGQHAVDTLANLPNLAMLGLWEESYIEITMLFRAQKFTKLKLLDLDGLHELEKVTLDKDTLPQLEQLSICRCIQLRDDKSGLSGIEFLSNLMELQLKEMDKGNLTRVLHEQVNNHLKSIKFLVRKPIPTTS